MKKLLLVMVLLSGAALAFLGYERLFAGKSFGPAAIIGFVVIGAFMAFALLSWLLYDTRHRAAIGGVWLAGITTVTFYLIADAIVGFVLIKPLSPALVPDEYRHHKLVPDSWSQLQQIDFSYTQRVNKLGLRGRETTVEKPAGVYRILTLGDSFTMGKGVRDEETFSALLEQQLNESPGGTCKAKKIEVLNGGVDSYAPILSNIELRRDLSRLSPDLVLHNLDVSDLVQEAAYRHEAVFAADGSVTAVPNAARKASISDRVHDWITQHLFFTRALLYYASKNFGGGEISVRTVATQANREIVAHTLVGDATPRDAQWRNIFESLDATRAFTESNHGRYVLVIYPWGHEVSDQEWLPGRYEYMSKEDVASDRSRVTIRQMAAERNMPLAEMHDVFRASAGKEKLYFDHDMHWTTAGHRVMATGLAQYLRQHHSSGWCE